MANHNSTTNDISATISWGDGGTGVKPPLGDELTPTSGLKAKSAEKLALPSDQRMQTTLGPEAAEGPKATAGRSGVRSVITDPPLRQRPAEGSAAKGADVQERLAKQGLDGHPPSNKKDENQTNEAPRAQNDFLLAGDIAKKGGAKSDDAKPANVPKGSASRRKSRAKQTTDRMEAFAEGFFFDYLSVTMTNEIDGSGEKPGLSEAPRDQEDYNKLARGPVLSPEREAAEAHEGKALNSLLRFVVSAGLYKRAEGEGRQGYKIGFQFGAHPTQGKPFVTVRGGHSRNMPSLEISGGNGECARIAPLVRAHLGPRMISRADVSIDIDEPGLFERLQNYMTARSSTLRVHPPEIEGDDEGGKTLYWLRYLGLKSNGRKRYRKRGVWLRAYQKDKERLARGVIAPEDVRPNLVRIEFVFLQDERAGKTKLALMTPQQMIADHRRSRELVQWLACECAGLTKEEAVMGLTKVELPAGDKTAEERAIRGIGQYQTPFIDAAIERLVERDFGGDWSVAEVAPREVRKEVARLVLRELSIKGAVENRILWHGLDRLRDDAEKAERLRDQMNGFLVRQKAAQDAARLRTH
ncbi:hypothetical protein GYB14_24080 [bacterium]|nr:hypothetical protein [bacterium]